MSITSSLKKTALGLPTWVWVAGGTLAVTGLALLIWRSKAAAKPLQPGERRILVVGDSLTVGYLPKLKTWLASDDVIGEGIGGAQVAAITSKAREYYDQRPTHVVVLAGINDVSSGKSSTTIYKSLAALWGEAKATGAKVVAVMLTPCGGYPKCKAGTTFAATREQVNNLIISSAGVVDAVIDTSALGDDQGKLLPEYSSGGLHLTSAGYQKLAELVADGMP